MSAEATVVAGYAGFLICAAFTLEWLSAHTHRRALRFRTAGFTYDELRDHWVCPEGEQLWPHEFDHDLRLVRYRARPHVCNACGVKHRCTDSDRGREIARPIDPWPHSEAGRFHRVIALSLLVLALVLIAAEAARHHHPTELGFLVALAAGAGLSLRWLLRDLRRHPVNFPAASASQGLGFAGGTNDR